MEGGDTAVSCSVLLLLLLLSLRKAEGDVAVAVEDVVVGDAAVAVGDVAEDAVEDDVVVGDVGAVDVGRSCLTGPGTASQSRTPLPPSC